jgi:hypothetical protein
LVVVSHCKTIDKREDVGSMRSRMPLEYTDPVLVPAVLPESIAIDDVTGLADAITAAKARANHTGTQAISTVTNLATEITNAKARANHTGVQAMDTITGLSAAFDAVNASIAVITRTAAEGSPMDAVITIYGGAYDGMVFQRMSPIGDAGTDTWFNGIYQFYRVDGIWSFYASGMPIITTAGEGAEYPWSATWSGALAGEDVIRVTNVPFDRIGKLCRVGAFGEDFAEAYDWYISESMADYGWRKIDENITTILNQSFIQDAITDKAAFRTNIGAPAASDVMGI